MIPHVVHRAASSIGGATVGNTWGACHAVGVLLSHSRNEI